MRGEPAEAGLVNGEILTSRVILFKVRFQGLRRRLLRETPDCSDFGGHRDPPRVLVDIDSNEYPLSFE